MSSRKRILITAGPTREPIDPVRFLSNASTGAQGSALAEEALSRGCIVDFVHGPLSVPVPAGVIAHAVVSAQDMLDAALRLHPACDAVIGAAAVSDFKPREASASKRKRGSGVWTLELVPTPDILRALGERKGQRIHAGFALETDDLAANALRKLHEKQLDWLVGNSPQAIGAAQGRYLLLGKDGTQRDLGVLSKRALAAVLLDAVLGTARP